MMEGHFHHQGHLSWLMNTPSHDTDTQHDHQCRACHVPHIRARHERLLLFVAQFVIDGAIRYVYYIIIDL